MKFRKKPVVIEAKQWLGTNADEMHEFIGSKMSWHPITKGLYIHTTEGIMQANPADWIIRGVAGEFYPCKPAVFEATYESAEERPKGDSNG